MAHLINNVATKKFTCVWCSRKICVSKEAGPKTCFECWELSGLENMVLDGRFGTGKFGEYDIKMAQGFLSSLIGKGVSETKVRTEFSILFTRVDELIRQTNT